MKFVGDVLEELYPSPSEPAPFTGPTATSTPRNRFQRFDSETSTTNPTMPNPKKAAATADEQWRQWFNDPWGVPYLYLWQPAEGKTTTRSATRPRGGRAPPPQDGLTIFPFGGKYTPTDKTLPNTPALLLNGFFPYRTSATKFVNPTTHQIVCAGPNGPDLNRPVLKTGSPPTSRPRGFGPGSPPRSLGSPSTFNTFTPEGSPFYSGETDGADDFRQHPRQAARQPVTPTPDGGDT